MSDLELVKRLAEFNLQVQLGINIDKYQDFENYRLVYSDKIKDEWYNYVTNIKSSNKEDFYRIFEEGTAKLKAMGRASSICVSPIMEEQYNNRLEYFNDDEFKVVSQEVWQVFEAFDKVDEIETKCQYKIELEKASNMDEYADALIRAYRTGESDDPYGNLDPVYRDAYAKYVNNKENLNDDFFIVKAEGVPVGITRSSYNDEFYGIYGIAINIKYRGKGIGKEVIKKQLQDCRDKNLKMAFLQTEYGYYPADLYRKIGFRDVCIEYIYTKK